MLNNLPNGIFANFRRLNYLYLDHNQFSIADKFFLNRLRILDLSSNRITNVSVRAFHNVRSLSKLSLANNSLHSLNPDITDYLRAGLLFDIRYNNFSCDCKFAKFVEKFPGGSVLLSRCVSSNPTDGLKIPNFDDKVCKNNGRCGSQENQYNCVCTSSYHGKFCENSKQLEGNETIRWIIIGLVTSFVCILLIDLRIYVYWKYQKPKVSKVDREICVKQNILSSDTDIMFSYI